jgi:hypothetical protein
MADSNSTVPVAAPSEVLFEEPYARLLPEFKALAVEELIAINLDIPLVVTTVLGAGPEILALADRIAKELPEFDLASLKKLEDYAMALSHAHTLYLMASQPPDSLQTLVDEGTSLRETLVTDANALVRRGLIDGNRLQDLKGPKGFRNLAVDLQILVALFRESFDKIAPKSGVQQEELLKAEQIAARILRAVGLREQGTALIAQTADIRVRAYTLLTRWYDQARRAVTYLRWKEDDVETISPSLFTGRGGRKRTSTDTPPAVVPGPAVPGAVGTANPVAPGTAGPSAPASATPADAGVPSRQPFLS